MSNCFAAYPSDRPERGQGDAVIKRRAIEQAPMNSVVSDDVVSDGAASLVLGPIRRLLRLMVGWTMKDISSFRAAETGIVTIEFAIMLPLLASVLSGVILFGMMQVERASVEKAASSLAALVSSGDRQGLTVGQMAWVLESAWQRTVWPESDDYRIRVAVFEVTDGTPARVSSLTLGNLSSPGLEVGVLDLKNGSIQFPVPISMNEGDRLVAVEAWRPYRALNLPFIKSPDPLYTYRVLNR